MEVDIYDVGNVLNAFGVFSRFRNDDRPGGVGLDSYVDDRSFLFYKGRYFVMLYATETNASVLKQLAMTLSSKIVDSSPPPKEIDLFPKNGLKTGSIQYFPEGLLGHTFLGRGFQASYVDEGEPAPQAQAQARESRSLSGCFQDSSGCEGRINDLQELHLPKGKAAAMDSRDPRRRCLEGRRPLPGTADCRAKRASSRRCERVSGKKG